MQKIQILFPDPVMDRLRAVAREQDRPVSELVRRAVDRLLEQMPDRATKQPARFPTFHGGGVLVSAEQLKDVIHGFDNRESTTHEGGSSGAGRDR